MRLQILAALLAIAAIPAIAGTSSAGSLPTSLHGIRAPDSVRVERSLHLERLDHSSGRARSIEAPVDAAWPGATLIYRLRYTNDDAKPQRIMVTNPLPSSVVYLSSAADGIAAEALVSVDGGINFGTLPVLRVRATKTHWYPASARDVTHVRFVTERPVKPGESGQFTVRLRLK